MDCEIYITEKRTNQAITLKKYTAPEGKILKEVESDDL
jgi:hypothetical protein